MKDSMVSRMSDERLAGIQRHAELWAVDYLPGSQKNAIGQDLLALLAEVDHLRARNAELEALARDVAGTYPLNWDRLGERGTCAYCDVESGYDPDRHDDDCPYRRAVELTQGGEG